MCAGGSWGGGEREGKLVARVYLRRETEWWRRIHLEGEPPSLSYTRRLPRNLLPLPLLAPAAADDAPRERGDRRPLGSLSSVWSVGGRRSKGAICLSLSSFLPLVFFLSFSPASPLPAPLSSPSIYLSNNFFLPLTFSFLFSSSPPPPRPSLRWGRCAFAGERAERPRVRPPASCTPQLPFCEAVLVTLPGGWRWGVGREGVERGRVCGGNLSTVSPWHRGKPSASYSLSLCWPALPACASHDRYC